MRFRVIEQAIFMDEDNQILEVFTNDPLADSKAPIDRLVDFVIERNNKYYADYYLAKDEESKVMSIKKYGHDEETAIFTTTNPRHFLSRVEYLRSY